MTRIRRTVDVIEVEGAQCVGTLHHPHARTSAVGLLWVNFGYVPRDGHGGLAAQACDAVAAKGVLALRYDLPGLGDAPGVLPTTTHPFFDMVTGGAAFGPTARALVRHLCAREKLDGLVVGGLCGGAVTAIFTADAEPELVRGLVLLEPEMYLTEPKKTAEDDARARTRLRDALRKKLPSERGPVLSVVDAALAAKLPYEDVVRDEVLKRLPLQQVRSKLFSYWGWMRFLTLENRYGRYVPLPRKAILDFVLSRAELPSVTNLPLAAAWQRFVGAGRPVLVITAEGKLREVFFDSINATVLSGVKKRHGAYEHVRLAHTNHIFTTGGAIATVTGHLERSWPMFGSA